MEEIKRNGWANCSLSDFTRIEMGQSPPSETYNFDRVGLPFFQGKAEFGHLYPAVRKFCSVPNKIAVIGATLLTVRAPVGPTNLADQRCCIGRGLAAIHPSDEILSKFVLYLFRSREHEIASQGTGSTFSAINGQYLNSLPVSLPPLDEQRRIVAKTEELFSELDDGIASLKTARAQLKIYRQVLLKHAFEGKLTESWRKNHAAQLESADQLLARIRAEGLLQKSKQKKSLDDQQTTSENYRLPLNWAWLSVNEVGNIETGTTPPTNDSSLYGDRFPFFKPTDLEQGINVRVARDYLSTRGRDYARILPAGTTLVTCIGATIGKAGLARLECATNQQINSISPISSIVSEFVYYQAIGPIFQDQVKSNASSTTLPIINKSKFARLPMAICSIAEQIEIIRILDAQCSAIDSQESDIDAQLQKAEALRQSILKKAFSGQLVAQDPADEPASVLLDRIRAGREVGQKKSVTRAKRG